MPVVNGPTRQPSFEEFVERSEAETIPAQLKDAEMPVEDEAGIVSPYEEEM